MEQHAASRAELEELKRQAVAVLELGTRPFKMQQREFRATLLDVFRVQGRGSIITAAVLSGRIGANCRICVGGVEMLVRGIESGRLPARMGLLVGEGHHEHLVACIGQEIKGV